MKFLPFVLASFIPARVLAESINSVEGDRDNLKDLFVETTRRVALQYKKVGVAESIIASIPHERKMRGSQSSHVAFFLRNLKKEDFKLHDDMLVKAAKSLRDIKVEFESQTSKIARGEKKLTDFKGEGESELQRAAEALELLQKAKSGGEWQARAIEKAEKSIRIERKSNEKHAEVFSSAKELLRDIEVSEALEVTKISNAEKFVKELNAKAPKHAADLAKIEPLLKVKAKKGAKSIAKHEKKVEAAKQSLEEKKAELKPELTKATSAEILTRDVLTRMQSHLKKLEDIVPLLDFTTEKGPFANGDSIKETLRNLEDTNETEAENIEKAEKLVNALPTYSRN